MARQVDEMERDEDAARTKKADDCVLLKADIPPNKPNKNMGNFISIGSLTHCLKL
jgi:hypothetical protein